MTTYVCQIVDTASQACVSWVEQSTLIPDLTIEQVTTLCSAYALFICVCAIFRMLRRAI